jgi:hypothetical protein
MHEFGDKHVYEGGPRTLATAASAALLGTAAPPYVGSTGLMNKQTGPCAKGSYLCVQPSTKVYGGTSSVARSYTGGTGQVYMTAAL